MSKMIRVMKTIQLREIRGCIVGGCTAVLVDYILYTLLVESAGLMASKIISYIIGASVGFVINKFLAFHSMGFHLSEILKYTVLYGISAVLNALINRGMISLDCIPLVAFLGATGITTIINFLGQKFIVFRKTTAMRAGI
jgi:putative flippase GtrA